MTTPRTSRWLLLAAAGLALGVPLASAGPLAPTTQPPPREAGPPRRPRDAAEAPPQDAPGMRRMIERRLEQLTRDSERFEQALKRLEQGESPAAVAKDLPPLRAGPEGEGPEPMERAGGPGRLGGPGRPEWAGQGRPEGAGRQGQGLTPAEREEIMTVIKEHAPLLAARMQEGRTNEPGMGPRMLGRIAPRIRDAMSYRKTDPDMFRLKMQDIQSGGIVLEAVQNFRRAQRDTDPESAAGVNKAEAELRAALLQQFDTRLAVQTREAEHLSKRLDAMRRDMDKRREMRDSEVDDILSKVKAGTEFRDPPPEPRREPE